MTQKEYFERFKVVLNELDVLTNLKNRDYAGESDAFKNFRQIEILTGGKINTLSGIFTRLSDKMSRLGTILFNETNVKSETIVDTLNDIAVYALIMRLYYEELMNEESKQIPIKYPEINEGWKEFPTQAQRNEVNL